MRDDLGPLLDPWDFALPDAQIARVPAVIRDQSRLYAVTPATSGPAGIFADILARFRPGDVLVLNDVTVMRARLRARRATGGAVEVVVSGPAGEGTFHAFVSPSRRLSVGERLVCGDGEMVLVKRHEDGTWTVLPVPDLATLTASAGEVPLPPYLGRAPVADDVARYQTVYAREGELRASAAPTAGLHFTPELLAMIEAKGVEVHRVALEVGAGTFKPLDRRAWVTGKLHTERFYLPLYTFEAVSRARMDGRRVIAVGTTSLRVLETDPKPGAGSTDLFIRPGFEFEAVDVLITNFHLPRSSLLMLVTTFGGHDRVMSAYNDAIAEGFRFYSYGDAMWVERG